MEHAIAYGGDRSYFEKPSIFDVYAIQATKSLLPRAFRQSTEYLASHFPSSYWCRRLAQLSDEVYLGFELGTETASLITSSAGVCESYYGVMRRSGQGKAMTRWQKIISIIEQTLLPYALRKWEKYSTLMNERNTAIKCLKWLIGAWNLGNVAIKYFYLFFNISAPSLAMLLARIKYGRSPEGLAWNTLTPLAAVMFVLRFVQWWQENAQSHAAMEIVQRRNKTIAPPLDFPLAHPQGLTDAQPGFCPICRGKPHKPIALVTGRIFCQKCLEENSVFQHKHKCPVTLESLREWQIRPIFIE